MSTSGGASEHLTTAHLDSAAIRGLFTDPTTVLPAPGAGKAIIGIQGVAQLVPGSLTQVVNPPTQVGFYYGTTTSDTRALDVTAPDMLTDAVPAFNVVGLYPDLNGTNAVALGFSAPVATFEDQPIIFAAAGAGSPAGDSGPIATSTLQDGGLGYAAGDTGTLADDVITGANAAYVVDTVDMTGAVLTYTITDPGDGYTIIDSPYATSIGGSQPGIGTGLTINVTSVPPFVADLYVTFFYLVVPVH